VAHAEQALTAVSDPNAVPALDARQALGKLDPQAFERLIAPHLGAAREEVRSGPGPGRDAAIVRIGAGRVMAVTTDPLSLIPELGPVESARLACHLVASDLWTSGIPPAYASVCLSLPPGMDDGTLETYARALGETWAAQGVAVVTGHTGRYEGCGLTIVGAATVIGIGDEGRTVGPEHVMPGDRVLVTKECAFEAVALAARLFPHTLSARLEEDELARLGGWLPDVSVVTDCRAALRVGVRDRGVSALHDATEGGVLGGLLELAIAAGHDLRVERARLPLSAGARTACEVLGLDPWWTLAEGALIVTARPAHAAAVMRAIADEGIAVCEVGEVVRGTGGLWLTEPDGHVAHVTTAEPDPWWAVYGRAVREGRR